MSSFEPSPVLVAYLFAQRFVFFECLAVLSLLRLIAGRGAARLPAVVTLLICALAILTSVAPALRWTTAPGFGVAARALAAGGGLWLPVLASGVFAAGLLFPSRAWRWLDATNLVLLLIFLGLWAATRV